MQELTVKLSQSVTFIADNVFCSLAWSFTLSLIVLSVWHLALKMLRKSYPDFFESKSVRISIFLKTSQRNDSVTILKLNVFGGG